MAESESEGERAGSKTVVCFRVGWPPRAPFEHGSLLSDDERLALRDREWLAWRDKVFGFVRQRGGAIVRTPGPQTTNNVWSLENDVWTLEIVPSQ